MIIGENHIPVAERYECQKIKKFKIFQKPGAEMELTVTDQGRKNILSLVYKA
jgi:hypothetical protein